MQQIPCHAFKKNPDGTWSTVETVTISTPNGQVTLAPGQTFRKGVLFMNVDLVALLEQNCT